MTARIGRPPTYAVRSGFFDAITPDSAYVVGLLQADGSNQCDRGIVCITLKLSDAPILDRLSSLFGGGRPLRYDGHGNPKLMVQNRALSDGLAQWGVISPKTHTASTHPALLGHRDYWRGVIDGDGSLCVGADGRRFLALVGSRSICDQWLAFAQTNGCGARVSVRPHKRIFSVHLSGKDATHLAGVLYGDARIALARKAAVARTWAADPRQHGPRPRPDRPAAEESSAGMRQETAPTAAVTAARAILSGPPASAHQRRARAVGAPLCWQTR